MTNVTRSSEEAGKKRGMACLVLVIPHRFNVNKKATYLMPVSNLSQYIRFNNRTNR